MARYERGVYEPDDEIRVFDGSEDDEDAEGSRLPLLIVLALLVLAMFAGVVWLAYTQGVERGRTEKPVIAAAGAARTASAAGQQTAFKGFKIYEQPAPLDDEADAGPAPAPAPILSAPPMTPSVAAPAETPSQEAPAKAAIAAPAQRTAPPPINKSVLSSQAQVPSPTRQAAVKPPAPKLASQPVGPATAPPKKLGAVVAPVPAVAAPAPKAMTAAPAASSGSYALQIGSYKSDEDASAAWRAYQNKHTALLAGYAQDVQRADLGDKGVWYRLRIAGFASKDVADAMCDRLKADGGNCFLAK